MENGGNIFSNPSRFDWRCTSSSSSSTDHQTSNTAAFFGASSSHALVFPLDGDNCFYNDDDNHLQQPQQHNHQHHPLDAGDGPHLYPDPHLTCLKLGKRHYFEDTAATTTTSDAAATSDRHVGGFPIRGSEKRGRPYDYGVGNAGGYVGVGVGPGPSSSGVSVAVGSAVTRCQVEGCNVALINAKDYHRRHKVCEMHSKAPKVTVLGLEQRFCQQCSRFHAVTEFDESKRSCRRRLAGHNERRRKSSHDSAPNTGRNCSQNNMIAGRFSHSTSPTGRALSLLSSKADSWISPSDLSSRSSAALRELIAEHRAAILARQLILEQHLHHRTMEDIGETQTGTNSSLGHQFQMFSETQNWDRSPDSGSHLTLDLMQAPSTGFRFLSGKVKSKEEEQECSELWNTLEGAHVT